MNISEVASKSVQRQEKKATLKVFLPSEKVMVLLPQTNNKLMLCLRGPYKIIKKQTHLVYLVDIDGRVNALHVNLLRKYHDRNPASQIIDSPSCSVSETLPTSGDIPL